MIATPIQTSPRNSHGTAMETVEVRYGTHRLAAHLDGWTIGEVKASLRDRWGVAYFAAAVLNGRVSEVAIRLQGGDRLEFRRFGFKGGQDNKFREADLLIASSPELQQIIAEANGSETVRKAVQFCLTWCGRPGQGDMAVFHEVLLRIASSMEVTASSVNQIANRIAPQPTDFVGRKRRERGVVCVRGGSPGPAVGGEDALPEEVTTAGAAKILGVSRDTVLKYRQKGLLRYRDLAPPGSSRPNFVYPLASVLELRTGYETESPAPPRPVEPSRRRVKGQRRYKHLDIED